MPPKTIYSEEECMQWRDSIGKEDGKVLNPKTGNYIKATSSTAKNIEKQCKKYEIEMNEIMVEQWIKEPLKIPYNGNSLNPVSDEYLNIYNKSFDILRKTINDDKKIINKLPKNHQLFTDKKYNGGIDLLYYNYTLKRGPSKVAINDKKYQKTKLYEMINEIELKDTLDIYNLEQQISNEISKTLDRITGVTIFYDFRNYIKQECKDYTEVNKWSNYLLMKEIIEFIDKSYEQGFANSRTKMNLTIGNVYNKAERIIKDVEELASGAVIENKENIVLNPMEDPIDNYFKSIQDKLEFIKDPKYNGLINITTYK